MVALAVAALTGCPQQSGVPSEPAVSVIRAQAVAAHPHQADAFTEGLLFYDGRLYESTGQYGASSLRRIDAATGRVEAERALPDDEFGEGLARYHDRLYQLTWKSGRGHVYDLDTLERITSFSYRGQGWGLATCGDDLVMSNGSDTLFFRDPTDFHIRRRQVVRLDGRPVDQLNELEVIDGMIWANQWLTDRILVIDPASGRVVRVIDAAGLAAEQPPSADVLNGIAYNAERDQVWITGKYWPRIYVLAGATTGHASPSVGACHAEVASKPG